MLCILGCFLKFMIILEVRIMMNHCSIVLGLFFFAQVVHISLLALIFSKIFDFRIPVFSSDNSTNKMLLLPFMGLFLILIFYYYKRKIKKYTYTDNGKSINLFKLILIVFLVVLIPLYLVIKLSGGEIWKFD